MIFGSAEFMSEMAVSKTGPLAKNNAQCVAKNQSDVIQMISKSKGPFSTRWLLLVPVWRCARPQTLTKSFDEKWQGRKTW